MNAQDNTITIKTSPGSKIALLIKDALERSRSLKDAHDVSYYYLSPFILESAGVTHDEVTGTFRIMHEMVVAPEPAVARVEEGPTLYMKAVSGEEALKFARELEARTNNSIKEFVHSNGCATFEEAAKRCRVFMSTFGDAPGKSVLYEHIAVPVVPIPMRLICPGCGKLHVDEGEFATKKHHTHACQHCGMVWRPAVWNTVGVRFLPGFKNEEPTS